MTIELANLTAIVGTNGCGKSAVLQALNRMFGLTGSDRTIERDDFHFPPGKTLEELGETSLTIEVRLDFPELDEVEDPDDADELASTIGDCFSQMAIDGEGNTPFCRVRLEATWVPSKLLDGVVEQSLVWVMTSDQTPKEADKRVMRSSDRSRIQVHYVPAARDPLRQTRYVAGSLLHHILRAVNWTDDVKEHVETSSEEVSDRFGEEEGVKVVQNALREKWNTLHDGKSFADVSVRPTPKRFDELLKRVETFFSPSPAGGEYPLERLSDGQKSLFYLAIMAAAFDIFGDAIEDEDGTDFDREKLSPPNLILFAIEEPENHLAPHYLGRIVGLIREISKKDHGQVVVTSHSASILARIEPEEVRYLRLDPKHCTTIVRAILLPDATSDAHKFVREAVRAHPELYFARLVILGEGDSEELVLPRVAEAMGLAIDPSFVSMVPLAGRHVNHFWKLLTDLGIPYVTLLDLDVERKGGGFGRIKYACKQLLKIGVNRKSLLEVEGGSVLTDEQLDEMHTWKMSLAQMKNWTDALEAFDVFYASPLDLDFMMLEAFPSQYQATAKSGPSIPDDPKEYAEELPSLLTAVLKEKHGDGKLYTAAQIKRFFWYRYLFLSKSKPTSHLLALADVKAKDLANGAPDALTRLVKRMKAKLSPVASGEDNAG